MKVRINGVFNVEGVETEQEAVNVITEVIVNGIEDVNFSGNVRTINEDNPKILVSMPDGKVHQCDSIFAAMLETRDEKSYVSSALVKTKKGGINRSEALGAIERLSEMITNLTK